jgi:hypothetical protein
LIPWPQAQLSLRFLILSSSQVASLRFDLTQDDLPTLIQEYKE